MRKLLLLPVLLSIAAAPAAMAKKPPKLSPKPAKLCKQYKQAVKVTKRKGKIYTRSYCLANFDGVYRIGLISSQDEGYYSLKVRSRAWVKGVKYCADRDWVDEEDVTFCEEPSFEDPEDPDFEDPDFEDPELLRR